ncbi:hypothetical protein BDW02DRAFT_509000 [Decorospora gaudefroyi]|uniref:BTB domain-containing protein n=1 Tax=Decorospora gaudefroyi TaxID=184978 RepID=A0A6A5JY62_9PLEO|nr:hypothetical protein BDW02DRAFT_509000 [Decorospora gaudefroyi]
MSSLSQPFDRLINGPMKEAQEMCVELPEIERDIFLRLVEFAYRGDYTMGPCANDSSFLRDREMVCNLVEDMVDAHRLEQEKSDGSDLDVRWLRRTYLPPWGSHPRERIALHFMEVDPGSHYSDHEAIFLAHGKIYCLGEYYIIPALKRLALEKLHSTLLACRTEEFLLSNARIDDVVALVAHAYSNDNTPDREDDEPLDALRQEVLEYVVIYMNHIKGNKAFQKLLKEGGQLPADLVRFLNEERRAEKKKWWETSISTLPVGQSVSQQTDKLRAGSRTSSSSSSSP